MARFYSITRYEMASLLEPWGFCVIDLPGVAELVWSKTRPDGIEMRVYSGIEGDVSREKGADAIRVYLFWHSNDGEVYPIGGSKRVHRVKGWRANLKARIAAWREQLGPTCKCGAPMRECVVKSGANKGKTFWGCATWKTTQCDGKVFPAEVWGNR